MRRNLCDINAWLFSFEKTHFCITQMNIIEATAVHVEQQFAHDTTGHDWPHIRRVWQMARRLAAADPSADATVTELAALLHDIADWKFHGGDYEAGPRAARAWLVSQGAAEPTIARVETIIREVSFKGLGVATPVSSPEAAIVQDADRLDAIGAIGIGRAFAYGGYKGRPMHDPAVLPVSHKSFALYQQNTAPTLNHFYEKLLHLHERLHTEAARHLGRQRHQYLVEFVAPVLGRVGGNPVSFGGSEVRLRHSMVSPVRRTFRYIYAMNARLLLPLFTIGLLLAGCRTCPIEACHTRKVHMHGGIKYRGQPLWKKQNPAVGEKIKVKSEMDGGKRANDKSKTLK